MREAIVAVLGAALLVSAYGPGEEDIGSAVAEHDMHPGLGHPIEGEGSHQHGDPDDHHESPESPCHHHDTHTCCTQGPTLVLSVASMGPDSGNITRILVPELQTFARFSVVEFLHVPLS